jgi:hypothetical protein
MSNETHELAVRIAEVIETCLRESHEFDFSLGVDTIQRLLEEWMKKNKPPGVVGLKMNYDKMLAAQDLVIERAEAEVNRLKAELKQVSDEWAETRSERNQNKLMLVEQQTETAGLRAEIERLRKCVEGERK